VNDLLGWVINQIQSLKDIACGGISFSFNECCGITFG
jgi:hypothetical protein